MLIWILKCNALLQFLIWKVRSRGAGGRLDEEQTGRLDVERLGFGGYQRNGCTAKLSCELLIYTAWRTATAFHPLCRHGRRWRGGLITYSSSFSFSFLYRIYPLISCSLHESLFIFGRPTSSPFLGNPWAPVIVLNQPIKAREEPTSRKVNTDRNWNNYTRGHSQSFCVAIRLHAWVHSINSFHWSAQL